MEVYGNKAQLLFLSKIINTRLKNSNTILVHAHSLLSKPRPLTNVLPASATLPTAEPNEPAVPCRAAPMPSVADPSDCKFPPGLPASDRPAADNPLGTPPPPPPPAENAADTWLLIWAAVPVLSAKIIVCVSVVESPYQY